MSFSPVNASKTITEKYLRYLHTIFSIDDPDYNEQFLSELKKKGNFSKGPYLEVSDSFEKGSSIQQLIDDNTLSKGFRKVQMELTRPLYKHQEVALKKVLNGKNLIVSTGTGSGKTESFLIPILNHLLREAENGQLCPGVRALLIYPMNALANDQTERLRGLLANCPEITFGSYTGQTKEKYSQALAEYQELNDYRTPLKNELISREQIRENPPHILITNYAMLEYLMVRPGDGVFFSEDYADTWKFVVLDEAHVYNGSSGIEVSMLLRRLKARLDNDSIQYILTSATLGDENSNEAVAEFGRQLCDSDFQSEDIVRAYRYHPTQLRAVSVLPLAFYTDLAKRFEDNASDSAILAYLRPYCQGSETSDIAEKLYDIILHDANYIQIRKLVDKATTVSELVSSLKWSEEELSAFVAVASKAMKNGDRLFDARYHMFLRATESVFVTLNPSKRLFLTRKKWHNEEDGTKFKVFELATCSRCHAPYLIGKLSKDKSYLEQASFNEDDEPRVAFLLKNKFSDTDEDHSLLSEHLKAEPYEICACCGFIRHANAVHKRSCEHGERYMVKAYRVEVKGERGSLSKCPACEYFNSMGILRSFFTGQEAVTAVLGTALFEELPSYTLKTSIAPVLDDDDGFGFDDDRIENTEKIAEAKQFIAFSDNRQAAAFYATYLDRSYRTLLYKRMIAEALGTFANAQASVRLDEFIGKLSTNMKKYQIAEDDYDAEREAQKAILQELYDNNGNTSLHSMGMIGFSIPLVGNKGNAKWKMTPDELQTLSDVFITQMAADGAVAYDFNLKPADKEFFTHNGIENSYTLTKSDSESHVMAFVPSSSGKTNKRMSYFKRVLNKTIPDANLSNEELKEFLETFWKRLYQKSGVLKENGRGFKIDSDRLRICRPDKWYICSKCHKLTCCNIHNVCPSYECDGELSPIDPAEAFRDNHYYRLYHDMEIRKLRVKEHTAQLNKDTAYQYQKDFRKKNIDILSCSTTFEMGVDVGTLETVFMRNVPPSPANYTQRAGRAGRSSDSAAYALTFCNKTSHDFSFFSDPRQMIQGRIDPPHFKIENEKIAIRHVYASALSFFWQKCPQYFKHAENMLEDRDGSGSGFSEFTSYLRGKPENLKAFLKRFLPEELCKKFDVENFGWLDHLLSQETKGEGVLFRAKADYDEEVGILEKARQEAISQNKKVDHFTRRIKNYRQEDILSFMSRKNIMPKYGFPVDTVEMTVNSANDNFGLTLQRDLAIAISEYAPGSQIVANGNLITSRYIRRIPNIDWRMYDYVKCDCGTLNIRVHTGGDSIPELNECRLCHKQLDPRSRKTFIIPSFGFAADSKILTPGLKKPERTYHGDISYIGTKQAEQISRMQIGNSIIEMGMTNGDEMAVVNDSNFFVCESCGYTDLDEKCYSFTKKHKHNNMSGFACNNQLLKRYSLGYRFKTDVTQLRFVNHELLDDETALSVLYGLMRGICRSLNIEQNDISGCVQYFYNVETNRANRSLILYDKTPGGAGHVRRLQDAETLRAVLHTTLEMMKACNCGGKNGDASCYACLRDYYNQKYHDKLNRGKVIRFIEELFEEGDEIGETLIKFYDTDSVQEVQSTVHVSNNCPFSEKLKLQKDGINLVSMDYAVIWKQLCATSSNDHEEALFAALAKRADELKDIEKPFKGCEFNATDGTIICDLLWKQKKMLLFSSDNEEAFTKAKNSDWRCFYADDERTTADVIINALKEE